MYNYEYKHYKNFPKALWFWKDFSPIELRSKSDNHLMIDEESINKLQALRTLLDKPLTVTSAYRSPAHNKLVGGAKKSKHLEGKAYDISQNNLNSAEFEEAARRVGFTGFGFYPKNNFIHIDTGPPREWGKRWWSVTPKGKSGEPNYLGGKKEKTTTKPQAWWQVLWSLLLSLLTKR